VTTEVSTTPLAEQVRVVATARQREAEVRDALDAARAMWEVANAEMIAAAASAKRDREAAETACRALALAHFAETGEKKPTPGVEIKERTSLSYKAEDAFAWGKEANGLCILPESLDVKAFEKVAKATPLPFVTITHEPSAQLASDLSAFATTE
jgi:hypothetical protein